MNKYIKKYRVYFIWPCRGDVTYITEECTIVSANSPEEAKATVWAKLDFANNRHAKITQVEEFC